MQAQSRQIVEGTPELMGDAHLDAATVEQIKQSEVCRKALALLSNEWQRYAHLKTLCPFYPHPFSLFDALRQAGLAEGLSIPLFRHGHPCGVRFSFRLRAEKATGN